MSPVREPSFVLLAALALWPRAVAAGPLLFEERTERLGAAQPCKDAANPNAEGCYSSYVAIADLNGDGHLDIVFANGGGYFVPAMAAPLAVYLSDGRGSFNDVNDTLFGGFEGRARQVAVGDVDGDGDLDLLVPDGYGLAPDALFINDGKRTPRFTEEGAKRLGTSSRAGAARFGDVNGDGALDLVIADWGAHPPVSSETIRVYLNDGRGYFHEEPGAVTPGATGVGTGPVDLDLFDANGDLVLDILVAHRKGNAELLIGDGRGRFTADASFPAQRGRYVYGPDECDVDGDGDLDVWLDNAGTRGAPQLLVNDGHGRFTDETTERVTGDAGGSDDNVVRCADVNGDGALDAIIGSVGGQRRVLLNDGHGHFTLYASAFPVQAVSTLGLDVGDLNGDRRLDVVTAQGEKGPFLNRVYFGTDAVPEDVVPPVIRAVERVADGTPKGEVVVRFAVRDGATTDVGPRLESATLEAGDETVAATFVGGDLFRATIHATGGHVTYRACAVDRAKNRACSEPLTFTPGEGGSVALRLLFLVSVAVAAAAGLLPLVRAVRRESRP